MIKQLGQHRINRQGGIAEDFVPDQSYKAGGILYVFPSFVTAELVQKTRCDPQTHLCGVALTITEYVEYNERRSECESDKISGIS